MSSARVSRHVSRAIATPVAHPVVLTVPVPPSANRWHRRFRGHTVLSQEAKEYTALLKATVRAPMFATEALKVEIHWFRHRKAGDVDKRGAILLDALQGIAYADDKQIADYRIVRHDTQPSDPRMVVTIQPMGE